MPRNNVLGLEGTLILLCLAISYAWTSLLIAAASGPASVSPEHFTSLCWVAYSPTNYDPEQGVFPSEESIRQDLQVLRKAGFDGLVTYGVMQTLGSVVPAAAQDAGFEGLLMGVWDPDSTEELDHACDAAAYDVTLGYVVGNEGLGERYHQAALETAMETLRQETGRPVATSEELGDYDDPDMLALGDWVFPNVHPYFADIFDATEGVEWTQQVFDDFQQVTDAVVIFKEVGYPTAGDEEGRVDEDLQADYYRQLLESSVDFVYFEAYDQPWKTFLPVEPYWGLFHADRIPQKVVSDVCRHLTFLPLVN